MMVTKEELNKAWREYYDYRDYLYSDSGNGCDDYRDLPAENINKLRLLEDTARKLQKEYDESQHYVPNDVWKFRISLKNDSVEKTIYTKPFPEHTRDEYETEEQYRELLDKDENLVKERYFTPERIQEYKDYFCKLIQESENPFDIHCVDWDGGWNVTEEELFNIDDSK